MVFVVQEDEDTMVFSRYRFSLIGAQRGSVP
jgi:hypothetical protein